MIDYRKKSQKKKFHIPSASHIMLFCILLMYMLVIICCLTFIHKCIQSERVDSAVQMVYALCSYSTVCGSSTIVVYANKASKENNIKIANDRYRMKIELAKEIYKSINNNTLDDKSIALIAMLIEEDKSDNLTNFINNIQNSMPTIPTITENINNPSSNDDALG